MMPRTAAFLLPLALLAASPAAADPTVQAKRTLNADGTTSLTYSSAVDEIGTVVGMDLSAAAASAAPVAGTDASTLGGTAYARLNLAALPDWLVWQKSSVNLEVSPANGAGKVATTFSRSFTVATGLDATLADTYSVTSASDAWETDKTVSLKLVETGTTFSVGTKATQETPNFLPTVSAQQKLFGDISLTTSVADTGSTLNKSITAGFSHRW
ncbi:hypothetical protein ACI7BZ_16370 [Xanthobacter sp. AM11]|uniref:hypothetical protein n=1 Tax=Xanthobacter sp. AM11 TaxID=3380643 RepID=UPI0039BF4A59